MGDTLREEFEDAAVDRREGGMSYRCLSIGTIARIAESRGLPRGEVSALAAESGFLPLRYAKNVGTTGLDGQARLLRSRVAVIGAGGIGGYAACLLARMGVGTLVLVDPDVFEETNLNRQAFCDEGTLGKAKVEVVRERLAAINGDTTVVTHRVEAGPENLPGLLEGTRVAIDALDNMFDRVALRAACGESGVVMVHGAIAGSSLQVTTVYPEDPGADSIVDPGTRKHKTRGIEIETGNPATTPALVAALEVSEAVKVIVGCGEPLRGRMMFMDTADLSVEFYRT